MGKLKNQNMKQASLIVGIIIILLIAGAFWVWQKGTEPDGITPTPPTPVEPVEPTEPTEPDSVQVPSGWKTYRNEELGFELAYPGEWFVYDQLKWEKDNAQKKCSGIEDISKSVILSSKNLGKCVGFAGDTLLRGDLNVHIYDFLVSFDEPSFFSGDPNSLQRIMIDGVEALKDPFTADSALPRSKSVQIFFNYQGKVYSIEFRQSDLQGNYDPIFDKILSTFKFLN